jgi:hypothetical protein
LPKDNADGTNLLWGIQSSMLDAQGPPFGTWDFFLNPIHSRPGVGLNIPLNLLAQFKPGL